MPDSGVSGMGVNSKGVLNEKLALFKLLSYMRSVYQIPQKIKTLTDKTFFQRLGAWANDLETASGGEFQKQMQ